MSQLKPIEKMKAKLTKNTITLPVFDPKEDKFGNWTLNYKRNFTFKNKLTFKKYIEKQIKDKFNSDEKLLTYMAFMGQACLTKKGNIKVCKSNLEESLLFAGVCFNTHPNVYDDMIYVPERCHCCTVHLIRYIFVVN